MGHDPFVPPRAELADAPRPPGSPLRAVLVGLAIDIGGTLIASMIAGLAVGLWLAAGGASHDDVEEALGHLEPSSPLGIALLAPGLLCSFLGGLACMRIVRRPTIGAGLVLAALSTAFSAWLSWGREDAATSVVLGAVGFLAVLAGSWLGRAREAAPDRPEDSTQDRTQDRTAG